MSRIKAVNPLPISVIVLFGLIAGIEILLSIGSISLLAGQEGIGWRGWAFQQFALPAQLLGFMVETSNFSASNLIRLVTYPFIHGSFISAAFACVILLALGKFVGDVFSSAAVLVVFFTSSILAAIIYSGLVWTPFPLYGAFPAVYGLIGAYTYILWVGLAATGGNQIEAFRLILLLAGLQIAFSLFGTSPHWLADFAGFFVGFAVAPIAAPGGMKALLARIKRR
ncbi:rhomboid family intramembrane serine protease [Aestuariibius insulae]|uniref:rhomboid family intramembrane serine protease n=1 Tax=Aestuariibius insulae TaxID=2058287 RepID=UPI00345E7827